ncbi:MAG TPA: hypothetical protein VGK54_03685 [Chloroflexota bacterium]
MRQISAAKASERGGWSQREAGQTSERWDDHQALAPGSFLSELARHLGTRAWDLLEDRTGALSSPEQRSPASQPSDSSVFHTRLMPAGWSGRASFTEFAPGSLFNFAG